jgi:hypothetical protein
MRTAFNALASRLTPGAGRTLDSRQNADSGSDDASVHGNVTLGGTFEDEKSDRDSDETDRQGQYFSTEFNDERSPRSQRIPETGFMNSGISLTEPRSAFQSSGSGGIQQESLPNPQRHTDGDRRLVTDSRPDSCGSDKGEFQRSLRTENLNRELGITDPRFSPHGADHLFQRPSHTEFLSRTANLTDPRFAFGGSIAALIMLCLTPSMEVSFLIVNL